MNAQATDIATLRNKQPNASGNLSFPKLLEASMAQINHALPRHITAERLVRVALTAFRQQPLLAKCEPKSVLASVFIAAQLGLEIGVLGEAYLLPFWNNKRNGYDCQLIVGYQGYIKLARNSGHILSIETHVIYEKDEYTLQYGLDPKFDHKPYLEGDPGKPKLVYCLARFKDGGNHLEVMTWDEIMKIKARSPSKNKAKEVVGPWITDETEMARKTAVRRGQKYWPKSVELATAAVHDGKASSLKIEGSEVFAQIESDSENDDAIEGTATEVSGGDQKETSAGTGASETASDAGETAATGDSTEKAATAEKAAEKEADKPYPASTRRRAPPMNLE
jgi:recombination protein RecT